MSTIKKQFGTYELDGVVHGPFRIGLKTKLQFEKTAKARKWEAESDPITTITFWTWHASKLAGAHELTWEDFIAQVEDIHVGDEDGSDVDEENPTEPVGTAGL